MVFNDNGTENVKKIHNIVHFIFTRPDMCLFGLRSCGWGVGYLEEWGGVVSLDALRRWHVHGMAAYPKNGKSGGF